MLSRKPQGLSWQIVAAIVAVLLACLIILIRFVLVPLL
jgi:hypothetical protein